jgi:hypothetical protein
MIPLLRSPGVLVTLTLASATIFYRNAEGWPWLDTALYSVATLATIAHPALAPVTLAGKIFTILFIIVGIGLFMTLAVRIARTQIFHDNR